MLSLLIYILEQMDEKIKSEKSRKLWGYCNALFNQINFMDQITETSGSSIKINKGNFINNPSVIYTTLYLPEVKKTVYYL